MWGFGIDGIVAMLLAAFVLAVAAIYALKKFGTD